MEPTESTVVK